MSNEKKNQSMALVPTSFEEADKLAKVFAGSQLLPQELRNKPADVFVTITAGMELGLAPMAALRSIHIIKGKPILSADGMVAVAQSSGLCEYFRCVASTAEFAEYETKRKGAPEAQRLAFTIDQAKTAGLTGGNWKTHPQAMLRARAKSALARDVYPDALAGVYDDPDEAREFSGPAASNGARYEPARPDPGVIDAEVIEDGPTPAEVAEELRALIEQAGSEAELHDLLPKIRALPEQYATALREPYKAAKARLARAADEFEGDAA